MAKNRWFGTWVLATLSLLGISRKLGVARTTQAGLSAEPYCNVSNNVLILSTWFERKPKGCLVPQCA